jgi:uncharacterized membrane protein
MAPASLRSATHPWTRPMKVFLALQLADMVTTMVFRSMGVEESNPLVNYLMIHLGTFSSLLLVKSSAVAIAVAYDVSAYPQFMRLMNLIYMAIVSINFLTICYATRH